MLEKEKNTIRNTNAQDSGIGVEFISSIVEVSLNTISTHRQRKDAEGKFLGLFKKKEKVSQ